MGLVVGSNHYTEQLGKPFAEVVDKPLMAAIKTVQQALSWWVTHSLLITLDVKLPTLRRLVVEVPESLAMAGAQELQQTWKIMLMR